MSLPLAVSSLTAPIRASCECPDHRRVPVDAVQRNVNLIKSLLPSIPRNLALYTYRCRSCRTIVTLRAWELGLSS